MSRLNARFRFHSPLASATNPPATPAVATALWRTWCLLATGAPFLGPAGNCNEDESPVLGTAREQMCRTSLPVVLMLDVLTMGPAENVM